MADDLKREPFGPGARLPPGQLQVLAQGQQPLRLRAQLAGLQREESLFLRDPRFRGMGRT